jgi:hypothetical protein
MNKRPGLANDRGGVHITLHGHDVRVAIIQPLQHGVLAPNHAFSLFFCPLLVGDMWPPHLHSQAAGSPINRQHGLIKRIKDK